MSKYLLPCECGKRIVIDASQAGQQITCECGAVLEIPTLRGVRELETVDESQSTVRRAADWDSSRGMIFAGSLILFFLGAGLVFFGYDGLRSTPKISREDEMASFEKVVDDMSLEEVYDTWKQVRDHGLGVRGQNVLVNIRSFRAGRRRVLVIGIVLAAVGLLSAVGTSFRRGKSAT